MKFIFKIGLVCATIVVIWGCNDLHDENAGAKISPEITTRTNRTDNIGDNYYWYKGEKIAFNKQEGRKFVIRQESNNTRTVTHGQMYTWNVEDESTVFQDTSNLLYHSDVYQTEKGGDIILSNRFFVKLKAGTNYADLVSLANEYNVHIEGGVPGLAKWYTLLCDVNSKYDAITTANIFYESGICDSSHPDPKMTVRQLGESTTNTPNDELFQSQWNLNSSNDFDIDYLETIPVTKGSSDVTIAVLDIGAPYISHEDLVLSPSNVYMICEDTTCLPLSEMTSVQISFGEHATNTVGIIAAKHDNNIGITGIAPNCTILPIDIRGHDNDSDVLALATALNFARQRASVISCSWEYENEQVPVEIIDEAIANAINNGRGGKGCVVVFAAGNTTGTNNDSRAVSYPANCHEDIIVVGAVDKSGYSYRSCSGDEMDIVAPGVEILTTAYLNSEGGFDVTGIPDGYLYFEHTSSACPQVAAVAGLILSQDTTLTMRQVTEKILRSASKNVQGTFDIQKLYGSWDGEYGHGMLNALAALNQNYMDYYIQNGPIRLNMNLIKDIYVKSFTFVELNNVQIPTGKNLIVESPTILIDGSDSFSCLGGFSIRTGNEIWNGNPAKEDSLPREATSINPFY
ncbi:MAG: S8 family serine peptidase [Rikenellaceae bacterium]|nr:S8 family serine peptidase [Rikenellaceae bacterium]